jgi:hypothetical protein
LRAASPHLPSALERFVGRYRKVECCEGISMFVDKKWEISLRDRGKFLKKTAREQCTDSLIDDPSLPPNDKSGLELVVCFSSCLSCRLDDPTKNSLICLFQIKGCMVYLHVGRKSISMRGRSGFVFRPVQSSLHFLFTGLQPSICSRNCT